MDLQLNVQYQRTDNPKMKCELLAITEKEITVRYWCLCHQPKETADIITEPIEDFMYEVYPWLQKEVTPDATTPDRTAISN